MTDRLQELHQLLVDELGHIGLHVKQADAAIGVIPQEQIDEDGELTWVPPVDLANSDDFQGDLIDGVKNGTVLYGIDVVCTVNQLAWTDRILFPEQHELDMQAEVLLGTDDDAIAAYIQGELDKGVAKKDIRIPKELLGDDE